MRLLTVLILVLAPVLAAAQDWEDNRTFGVGGDVLRVISSTDTSFMAPVIDSFLTSRPNVSVQYLVTGTADLDGVFRAAPADYDVVISSAMDLQLKLANDGFAARIDTLPHPDWAQWNQSVFAFTTEPAAIVINAAAFKDLNIPDTRQALIEVLRANAQRFDGKVGTYDVRQSGLGYLFATQDARASETFWRLMEVMGGLNAQLYCCSGDMIDDLLSGKLLVAYNVLGSYAVARAETTDALTVILPSEFPTTMMRTALVSGTAPDRDLAEAFVRHLVAVQSSGAVDLPLPPLTRTGQGATIGLDPALMTYLDRMKRQTFVREWENALVQTD